MDGIRSASKAAASASLSGPVLREMFIASSTWLDRHAEAINALNVFPVPDGDTGLESLAHLALGERSLPC